MVEAVFLHRPVVRDPGSLVFELMRAEAAIPHPSNFLGDDKARVLEDSYVLLDARKGHIEARGQIADRRIRPPKTLQNPSTRRIGECGERVVEPSLILNHMVQYSRKPLARQPPPPPSFCIS